jgi:hypothetical protein
MQDNANFLLPAPGRIPWNKGKLIGAKPPLRQKHVWAIRTKLQIDQRTRDLAMFNLAIDSKLRGRDVVALKVEDLLRMAVPSIGATVRQKMTGRTVRFELRPEIIPSKVAAERRSKLSQAVALPPGQVRRLELVLLLLLQLARQKLYEIHRPTRFRAMFSIGRLPDGRAADRSATPGGRRHVELRSDS